MSTANSAGPAFVGDSSIGGQTIASAGLTIGASSLYGDASQSGSMYTAGTTALGQLENNAASASAAYGGSASSSLGSGSSAATGTGVASSLSLMDWAVIGGGGLLVVGLLIYGFMRNKHGVR